MNLCIVLDLEYQIIVIDHISVVFPSICCVTVKCSVLRFMPLLIYSKNLLILIINILI